MVKIQEDINLKRYNTYGVGGNAKYFVLAKQNQDLIDAFNFTKEKTISFLVLGKGSNVLVPDNGYKGLVIVNNVKEVRRDNDKVYASSGITLARLINFTIDEGLSGLESLAGIPGTLGGAIIGNAGSFGGEIANVIDNVEVISNNGEVQEINKDSLTFGYRDSQFKHGFSGVILGATLKLEKSTIEEVRNKKDVITEKRSKLNQPVGKSCGSFFKNVKAEDASDHLLKEVEVRGIDGNIPAGKLIDLAGCKGMKVGEAEVSNENANFLINTGSATAADIKELAEQVKKKVFEKFGVELETEVRYL